MDAFYFRILCFCWAGLGIISRIFMGIMGQGWNQWEMNRAYAPQKPIWVNPTAGLGLVLVVYTWYRVFSGSTPYSWVIAVLISLTLIKLRALVFDYGRFRRFVGQTLEDHRRKRLLDICVLIFSAALIILGLLVY